MERRSASSPQATLVSLVAATADIDEVVGAILRESAALSGADRCLVALPGHSGRHLEVAEAHTAATGCAQGGTGEIDIEWGTIPLFSDSPLGEVVRTGRRVVRDVSSPATADAAGALVAFPLSPSSGALGGIAFVWNELSVPESVDLERMSDFATLAGLAVERTRLRRRERHFARAIRGALLGPLDTGHRVEAFGSYHPPWSGTPLGGDWYDAFTTADEKVVLVLGDVTGHGVDASPTMLSARTFVRAFMFEDPDPAMCLGRLDDVWAAFEESAGMVSVLLAVVDPRGGVLRWMNAGLPDPVLRRSTGKVVTLEGGRGRPAGSGMPRRPDSSEAVKFGPGDLLVAYTDGFTLPVEAGGTDPASIAAAVGRHGRDSLRSLVSSLATLGGEGEFRTDDASVLAARIS